MEIENIVVELIDGKATTTSLDVAARFGKRHDDVLKRLRNLDCSDEFHLRNFAEAFQEVAQPNGGVAKYPTMRMTRDGFTFLCMGFTGKEAAKWKEAYINAFNQMEKTLRESSISAMQSFNDALAIFEKDKSLASIHGQALARWKGIRKQHIEAVTDAHEKAQLLLNFK